MYVCRQTCQLNLCTDAPIDIYIGVGIHNILSLSNRIWISLRVLESHIGRTLSTVI